MKYTITLAVSALALFPLAGLAQTLAPSQDAYYVPSNGTNFGTATSITVGSSGSVGLVEFDLTQLPAGVTAAQIKKATLTLFLDHVGSTGTMNIDTVSSSTPWSELTVTGNSGISPGSAVATSVPVTTAAMFLTVDATAAVQGWITAPASNNGFLLIANSGANIQFDSKENLTTNHPAMLTVVLAGIGATGPTGPTGAASTVAGPTGPIGPAGATGAASTVAGPAGVTGPAGSTGPLTINFVCANSCSQYGLQTLVPVGDQNNPNQLARVNDAGPFDWGVGIAGPPGPVAFQNGFGPGGITYSAGQTVPLVVSGVASCQFDNQVVAGDFIQPSQFNGGFCHSSGSSYPSDSQVIGIALSANGPGSFGSPFAQSILLFGPGVRASAVN